MAGWFITGTDTGVGKTLFSVALLRVLRTSGVRVVAMKPVASGCEQTAAGPRNADALQLQRAAAGEQDYTQINPYAFAAAIAPHLAAQLQGERIDLERIVACARTLQEPGGQLIVEGIGGWQVPLQATTTVMDLAVKLQLPVVLVVGMRLGCLNHALLTVESILSSGLVLYGWVANELVPEMQQLQANIDCLQERIEAPLLARIPWQSQPEQPRVFWLQQPGSYSRTAS